MNTAQFVLKLSESILKNQNQEINQVLLTVNYLPVMSESTAHNHLVSVNSKDYKLTNRNSINDGLFCSIKQAMLIDSEKFLESSDNDYLTDKYNTLQCVNRLASTGAVGMGVGKFKRNETLSEIVKNLQSSKGFHSLMKDYRKFCYGFIDTVHRVPAYPPYKSLRISESEAFEGSDVEIKNTLGALVETTSEFTTPQSPNSKSLTTSDARMKLAELSRVNRLFVELKSFGKDYNNGSVKSQPPYFCLGLEPNQKIPEDGEVFHPSTIRVALERNPNVWDVDKALRVAYEGSPMSDYIPFEEVDWVMYKAPNSTSVSGYKDLKPLSAYCVFTRQFYEIEQFVLSNFKSGQVTSIFDDYETIKDNFISDECQITIEEALDIYFRQMIKASIELGEYYYRNTPRHKMPLGAGSLSDFVPVAIKFEKVFNPLTDIYFRVDANKSMCTNILGAWFPDLRVNRGEYRESVPLLEKSLNGTQGVQGFFLTRSEAMMLISNRVMLFDRFSEKMFEAYQYLLPCNIDNFNFRLYTSLLYPTLFDLETACDRSSRISYYSVIQDRFKDDTERRYDFIPSPHNLCLIEGQHYNTSKGQETLVPLFKLLKGAMDSITSTCYKISFQTNSNSMPNRNTLVIEELYDTDGVQLSTTYQSNVTTYYLNYRQYCRFLQVFVTYHLTGDNQIVRALTLALSLRDLTDSEVYEGFIRLNGLVRKTLEESGFCKN